MVLVLVVVVLVVVLVSVVVVLSCSCRHRASTLRSSARIASRSVGVRVIPAADVQHAVDDELAQLVLELSPGACARRALDRNDDVAQVRPSARWQDEVAVGTHLADSRILPGVSRKPPNRQQREGQDVGRSLRGPCARTLSAASSRSSTEDQRRGSPATGRGRRSARGPRAAPVTASATGERTPRSRPNVNAPRRR